jgi:hypothetical protein
MSSLVDCHDPALLPKGHKLGMDNVVTLEESLEGMCGNAHEHRGWIGAEDGGQFRRRRMGSCCHAGISLGTGWGRLMVGVDGECNANDTGT